MNEIFNEQSDLAISAALEANLIKQVRYYAESPLATFFDDNNMVRFITGLPVSILNLVAGANFSEDDIDQKIESALAPFKKQNVPMIWWVGPTTIPKNLGIYLEESGLKKGFDMPGMYYELENLEKELKFPPKFTFKVVDDDALLKTWAETQVRGFESQPSSTKHIYEFEKTLGTNPDSPWLRYIGFIDEEPATVSILFREAGVAAIFNVATTPKFRRQGLGTLMTLIPLLKARSMDYKYGVLKASPMGTLLYRKLKLKECCKIGLYYQNFQNL